jgi:AraC family transcriptional regulator, transcriptional activator FtrA
LPIAQTIKKALAAPHRVVVLAYDGLCTFEFGIVVEMFGLPRPELDSWYSFSVCGLEDRPLHAVGGITITPQGGLSDLRQADTIIIPGWRKPYEPPPERLLRVLVDAHECGARLVSICVGSFVLGATGLLNGRRATTHWKFLDQMARAFPLIRIQPDVLYVDEQDILTSAAALPVLIFASISSVRTSELLWLTM